MKISNLKFKIIASLYVVGMLLLASCSRSVTRIDPSKQVDLSGRWNDTDAKLVAEEMIKDVMTRPWFSDFNIEYNRKPVVIVGIISNKTTEHIASEPFIKDIEREFVNSNFVRVVENDLFREKLREERAQQGDFASKETQAQWGKELGADFMLFGVINSTTDQYKKEKIINYKVNLELASIETTEKVWIGDKEIKKFIKN